MYVLIYNHGDNQHTMCNEKTYYCDDETECGGHLHKRSQTFCSTKVDDSAHIDINVASMYH